MARLRQEIPTRNQGANTLLEDQKVNAWLESISLGLADKAEEMEKFEKWTLEDPEINEKLEKWAHSLDIKKENASTLIGHDKYYLIVEVLAYVHTRKALRLLSLTGKLQSGLGGDLIEYCRNDKSRENQVEKIVHLSRIREIIKLEYYEKIFGPEKRKEILDIIKGKQND